MPLGYRLIRTLAACVACFSCIATAAAQSPETWAQCTNRDPRLVDQAIAACSDIISASDNDRDAAATARALVARARASISRADWSRAAADLDRVLQRDTTSPDAAYAFTARATARYQMSDFAGAIADCDAALRLDPRNEQALRLRSFAHVAQGTASSADGAGAMPDALQVYLARGPAGSCGEKCEEWIAVEGTVDFQGPQRLIAALDRLGGRKLPVVLNFRGASNLRSAMNVGKILRDRGFEAAVGQTLVDECDDPLQARCMALKRAGKPLQARLVPSRVCDIACLLGLAGGVRRTLPDATTVVIGGMVVANRIGLQAAEPFREGRHVRMRDLVKVHFTQMGVDPQVADMLEEHLRPSAHDRIAARGCRATAHRDGAIGSHSGPMAFV
jgi:hypothetical protein